MTCLVLTKNRTMEDPTFAVFAGREKLVYDTILLGSDTFNINSQVRSVHCMH